MAAPCNVLKLYSAVTSAPELAALKADIDRIRAEIVKMLARPDIQDRIKAMGNEAVGSTPAEFDAYYKAEIAVYTNIIADAKIPRQ